MKKWIAWCVCLAMAASIFASIPARAEEKYSSSAVGKNGDVTVSVTFDGNEITEISIDEQEETEAIAGTALTLIPQMIIDRQSLDVEAVSGATITSDAILAAVADCVEQAEVTLEAVEATYEKDLDDGTYTATAHGHHSDVSVEVEILDNEIANVTVTECGETVNIAMPAIERIPASIVENQSISIDCVSGATFTSNAILSAVADTLIQAGGDDAVLAFSTVIEPEETERDEAEEEYDIIVVGSGLAGISAALTAQQEGANVLLLEKLPFIGGTSQTAAGGVVYPTEESKAGFEEYLLNRNIGYWQGWMKTPNAVIAEANVHVLAENAEESVKWMGEQGVGMMEMKGVSPEHYTIMEEDGTLTPKINYVDCNLWIDDSAPNAGGKVINKMADIYKELGGVIYTETPATSLIVDDEGTVIGVKAESPTTEYTLYADSVILCAGGFGASEEMIVEYAPAYIGEINTTLAGNTGDGIRMGAEIGAAVYEDAYMMGGSAQTIVTDADMISPYSDAETPKSALYVNPQGIRVNSEDPEAYSNSTLHINPDSRDYYWVIINQDIAEQNPDYLAILEEGLKTEPDRFFTAESISDLAKQISMVPNTLINTIDNYNYLCEQGEDTMLFKGADYLIAMNDGPWYAVKAYMQYFGTVGGLVTNEKAQVLDTNGEVIPGLYAAGENSNHGVFERCYSGGISLTESLTFGRIAAKDAVEKLAD